MQTQVPRPLSYEFDPQLTEPEDFGWTWAGAGVAELEELEEAEDELELEEAEVEVEAELDEEVELDELEAVDEEVLEGLMGTMIDVEATIKAVHCPLI